MLKGVWNYNILQVKKKTRINNYFIRKIEKYKIMTFINIFYRTYGPNKFATTYSTKNKGRKNVKELWNSILADASRYLATKSSNRRPQLEQKRQKEHFRWFMKQINENISSFQNIISCKSEVATELKKFDAKMRLYGKSFYDSKNMP